MDLSASSPTEVAVREPGPPHRTLSVEVILYLLIFVLAVATRFAFLDAMALHQDESTHAYYGWSIYTGRGWTHDAVYHGPLIYHMEALGFALFGDSDGTTRITLALFSVGTVMLPALLRRQLGRWGALISSFLFLISPTFLYFGRFGHPDVFGAALTLLLFVCVVRYLAEPTGSRYHDLWLYGAVLAAALHFCAKPTAYLAVAVFLLFLGGHVLWERHGLRVFWLLLGLFPAVAEDLSKALFGPKFQLQLMQLQQYKIGPVSLSIFSLVPLALAILVALGMLAWRWWEGWSQKKNDPSLDLVVVLGTMVLPLLSAIPLNLLVRLRGLDALQYNSPDIPQAAIPLGLLCIVACFLIAAVIGLRWDARRWIISAAIFWGIFFVLYTSFFSSMTGWFTGLVQTLGFWMAQQNVKRIYTGPQYFVVMLATYETVSLLFGIAAAAVFAWRGLTARPKRSGGAGEAASFRPSAQGEEAMVPSPPPLGAPPGVATGLLAFWGPTSLLLFSLAGEQVPWLNLHPALPLILLSGALLGCIVSYRPRQPRPAALRLSADGVLLLLAASLLLWAGRPLLGQGASAVVAWAIGAGALVLLAYLTFRGRGERWREAAFGTMGAVIGIMVIFQASAVSSAKDFAHWPSTIYPPLLLLLLAAVVRIALLGKIALRSTALLVFAFLCVYGVGSAFRLAYINPDTPVEFAVYVQTSPDVSRIVDEIGALSKLTTGGTDMVVLYDTEVSWPLEWYLRDYPHRTMQIKIAGPPPENTAVAVVSAENDATSSAYLESRFYPYRSYAFNWWFGDSAFPTPSYFVSWIDPEDLKGTAQSGLKAMLTALWNPPGQARSWRYLLYREPAAPLGTRDFVFYVRRDLLPQLELLQDTIQRR